MSKISNLLEMIIILQYKELTTASELSEILKVDKKTIYRYINSLNEADIPVCTKKGRYGGFYIDKSFYMKPANLSEEELKALLMVAKVFTEKVGFIYERDLKSAVHKIKSLYVNKNTNLNRVDTTGNFSIDSIGNIENLEDKIYKISSSMTKGRSLNINYFSINKNNLTMRKVDPYDLIFKEGEWHVIGYCHMKDDVENFKLNRIKSLKVSNDIYMRPRTFSLKDYLNNHWGLFGGNKIKVVIKFNKEIVNFIQHTKWHINQNINELQSGSILFTLYVDDIKDVKQWIMGFGKNAEIIEPEELRQSVKLEVEELYKKYYNF
ncbi:helix-turn-helix transcriptional regulator [Clostridium sp. WILCCON 0269]|uniref:Helix-turn-helix transcriptional regulator n=1 Tax=Candidatus Clostridium eludens TaxID=3381663 RepID=A0ABW8SER5_9CLOT